MILTHVTLKQGQSHQTWHELVDPKQGYNNAKFEKSCANSVHEKAIDKVFVKSGNASIISLEYMCESKKNIDIFMTCLRYLTILQSLDLIR